MGQSPICYHQNLRFWLNLTEKNFYIFCILIYIMTRDDIEYDELKLLFDKYTEKLQRSIKNEDYERTKRKLLLIQLKMKVKNYI